MHDEYLTPEQVSSLKAILEGQLENLLSQSRQAVTDLTEQRTADPDPLDLAVSESNRDFTLRLADRERRLVAKIRHALERIQQGEHGTCEVCGGPIDYQRLLARPVATQCIDCKTEAEQMERRRRAF